MMKIKYFLNILNKIKLSKDLILFLQNNKIYNNNNLKKI